MTYIPRREVTRIIPNKFEAVRVLALECRRLNEEFRAREEVVDVKITTTAVDKLLGGEVAYFDARERREQERSEAMLSAAEELIDMAEPDFGDMDMEDAVDEPAADPDADVEAAPVADAAPAAEAEAAAAPEVEAAAEAVEAAASEGDDEAKE